MSELTPHWVEKKATYRRRKHPVQKPWGGAENGLFCWTASLARWLEHSREGVFSYKSNQHWGSDLDLSFFFFFFKKALDIATWEPLDARARTSEAGDAFKLWNWLHKSMEMLTYQGTGIDSIQQYRYYASWITLVPVISARPHPLPVRWASLLPFYLWESQVCVRHSGTTCSRS